ncbi:unnamed protein product, partial [marine sediment metagenome]
MVDIKDLDRNLNHIYLMHAPNLEVPVGNQIGNISVELELYEKSLALAGDLKRLPVLVSINGIITMHAGTFGFMNASNWTEMTAYAKLWNRDNVIPAEYAEIEDRIAQWSLYAVDVAGAIILVDIEPNSIQYQGGILLASTITLSLELTGDVVVAG